MTDGLVGVVLDPSRVGVDESLSPGPSGSLRFGCEVALGAQVRGQDFGE